MKRSFGGLAVVILAVLMTERSARAGYIYWSDWGTSNDPPLPIGDIRRSNLDGSGRVTLISGLRTPGAPSLDVAGGHMYYGSADGIFRANLDGTGSTLVVSGGAGSPTLDLLHNEMYWNENAAGGAGQIWRAHLDGSGKSLLVTGLDVPRHLSLDLAAGKIYWADNGSNGSGDIRRANLDGTGEQIILPNLPSPAILALDIPAGKMYWPDNDGEILRANLDGSSMQVLVRNLNVPNAVVLDLAAGQMYWCDFGTDGSYNGDIRRANLDGTGQTPPLVSGLGDPVLLTLDVPEPGSALLLTAGCALPLALRSRVRRPR